MNTNGCKVCFEIIYSMFLFIFYICLVLILANSFNKSLITPQFNEYASTDDSNKCLQICTKMFGEPKAVAYAGPEITSKDLDYKTFFTPLNFMLFFILILLFPVLRVRVKEVTNNIEKRFR